MGVAAPVRDPRYRSPGHCGPGSTEKSGRPQGACARPL